METPRRLVLAGAGHAHLGLIHSISRLRERNVSVTVVDPNAELWYSGMMPAVLGGGVDPSAARINVRRIVEEQGGEYLPEALTEIRAGERIVTTTSGTSVGWDVLSVAVGSTVVSPFPVAPHRDASLFAAKPIEGLPDIVRRVRELATAGAVRGNPRPVRVVFIGGGPSAVELAGNLAHRLSIDPPGGGTRVSIAISTRGDRLLPRMPAAAAMAAMRSLTARGITVRVGVSVEGVTGTGIECDDATTEEWDVVVLTTGLQAPELFRRSGLPTDRDGALRVGRTLRTADAPIYGGGDCIAIDGLPLARAGVHAVRQQAILMHNIAVELGADLRKRPSGLITYTPPPSPLLILNLGDGTAVSVRGNRVRHGRLPALLKERIDWGFVASEGRSIFPAWRPPPRPPRPPQQPRPSGADSSGSSSSADSSAGGNGSSSSGRSERKDHD
jgi:NADH dehydrogenase FAD-containing subunit